MESVFFQEGKFLTWKRSCSGSKLWEKIQLLRQRWAKIPVSFDFEIFPLKIITIPDTRYDIGRIQTLGFSIMSKCTLCKWCKSLDFVISSGISKWNCIINLMLILCLRLATLFKTRLCQRCFLTNFARF